MTQIRLIHIVSKLCKVIPKNFYSTTTVNMVAVVLRVVTTRLHISKGVVKTSERHSVSVLTTSRSLLGFKKAAATACRVASNYMRALTNNVLAAFTREFPVVSKVSIYSTFGVNELICRQSSELFTSYISYVHIITKGMRRLVSSAYPSHTRLIIPA